MEADAADTEPEPVDADGVVRARGDHDDAFFAVMASFEEALVVAPSGERDRVFEFPFATADHFFFAGGNGEGGDEFGCAFFEVFFLGLEDA